MFLFFLSEFARFFFCRIFIFVPLLYARIFARIFARILPAFCPNSSPILPEFLASKNGGGGGTVPPPPPSTPMFIGGCLQLASDISNAVQKICESELSIWLSLTLKVSMHMGYGSSNGNGMLDLSLEH